MKVDYISEGIRSRIIHLILFIYLFLSIQCREMYFCVGTAKALTYVTMTGECRNTRSVITVSLTSQKRAVVNVMSSIYTLITSPFLSSHEKRHVSNIVATFCDETDSQEGK